MVFTSTNFLFVNNAKCILLLTLGSFLMLTVSSSEICGTVTTSEGNIIELRENTTLSSEEFDKLHIKKLKNAEFSPKADQQCVITVCGFTSYGRPYDDNFIGSSSDYADCRIIRNEKTQAPPEIYNDLYNVSSISCACKKNNQGCTYSCEEKRHYLQPSWKENECALLFEEEECNNCYYDSITLKTTDEYSTDVSHHINSIFVKDDCVVRQDIPAFRHFLRFHNATLPLNYTKAQGSNNVMSAFHSESEKFFCECGISPDVTTTAPDTTTMKPARENDYFIAVIVLGTTTFISLVTLGLIAVIMWNGGGNSEASHLPLYLPWLPFIKRSSNDSLETQMTSTTASSGPFDYNRIVSTPFNEAYDTPRELYEIGNKLNQGNHGEIYEAKLKVVLKVIKKSHDEESFRALHQEAKFLSRIGTHENVVRLLGVFSDNFVNGELCLLVEYCQYGSLKSYLTDKVEPKVKAIVCRKKSNDLACCVSVTKGEYADEKMIRNVDEDEKRYNLEELDPDLLKQMYSWAEQIANGMEYISSVMKVIHGDLASRNVLINHKLVAKIADFGLAKKSYLRVNETPEEGPSELPVRWLAREVLCEQQDCSVESDVWSFGIVVWEIFTLGEYLPYHNRCGLTQIAHAALRSEKPGHLISCVSPILFQKLLECWDENPKKRPTFSALRDYFSEKKKAMEEESEKLVCEPSDVCVV